VRSLILILGLVLGVVGICLFVGALLMGFSVFAIPVGVTGTFLMFFGPWGAWQYYKNQKENEYPAKHAATAEKERTERATREREDKEAELKKATNYVKAGRYEKATEHRYARAKGYPLPRKNP
jgi:hypothetical protein